MYFKLKQHFKLFSLQYHLHPFEIKNVYLLKNLSLMIRKEQGKMYHYEKLSLYIIFHIIK